MDTMFYKCEHLKTLDLKNFNTSNVINFGYMFANCYELEELDLSSFTFNMKKKLNATYFLQSSAENMKNIVLSKSIIYYLGRMAVYCSFGYDFDEEVKDLPEVKKIKIRLK